MINEGLYLIDGNGEYIYYLEFVINSVRNSVDINTYPVPISIPDGFSDHNDWVGYPSVSYHPNLIIPSNSKFNQIIGYSSGFETGFNSGISVSLSYSSSVSPDVNPNSNLLVDVNLTDNAFASPTGVIASIVPDVGVGSLLRVAPPQ